MFKQFQDSLSNLIDKLMGWLDSLIIALPNFILAALVLMVSLYSVRYLKKGISHSLRKLRINSTFAGVLTNVFTALFSLIVIFIVLGILNLDKALTSLLAGAGVIGLTVGLALQEPIMNLLSGLLMSVKNYYKVGDWVDTNDYFGQIRRINLRSTIISTPDGHDVILPNKMVLNTPLKNYTHRSLRRIEISCGVSYKDDLEKVEAIAVKAIEDNLTYMEAKPIDFFFTEFGDSSINFVIRFWQPITSPRDYLVAKHKAIVNIKKAFDKHQVSIPFPVTTLDFGIEGGIRLDEMYPLKKMFPIQNRKKRQVM